MLRVSLDRLFEFVKCAFLVVQFRIVQFSEIVMRVVVLRVHGERREIGLFGKLRLVKIIVDHAEPGMRFDMQRFDVKHAEQADTGL